MKLQLILCCFIVSILSSCVDDKARIFEKNQDINGAEWKRDSVPEFRFTIEDTSAQYHLIYTVRNGTNYPYYNLYLESDLVDSTGLIVRNFTKEIYLFDASTGKPFGEGNSIMSSSLGDLFDGRYLCESYFKFPHQGEYTFSIKQYMRDEQSLEGIYAVGLRVEKVEGRK